MFGSMTTEESRAVSFLAVLLVLATAARYVNRPRPITISAAPIDVAALQAAGRSLAQQGPPPARKGVGRKPAAPPRPPPVVYIEDAPKSAGPLDLNRASAEEIEGLPGIGRSMALKIVARRDSVRRFRRLEDLDSIRGIGPALIAKLRPLVVVR